MVFRIWISLRIRSQNRNGSKCSVRDLGQSDLCKNLGKFGSLPCPFKKKRQIGFGVFIVYLSMVKASVLEIFQLSQHQLLTGGNLIRQCRKQRKGQYTLGRICSSRFKGRLVQDTLDMVCTQCLNAKYALSWVIHRIQSETLFRNPDCYVKWLGAIDCLRAWKKTLPPSLFCDRGWIYSRWPYRLSTCWPGQAVKRYLRAWLFLA